MTDQKKNKKKPAVELVSLADYGTNKIHHWISTGIHPLDFIIRPGEGGIPSGKITMIFGEESSGKSTLLAYILKNAQAMAFITLLVDMENTFNEDFASRTGLDPNKLQMLSHKDGKLRRPPDTIEELEDAIVSYLKDLFAGKFDPKVNGKFVEKDPMTPVIIGIDSLGALQTDARLKEGKKMIGDKANALSTFLPRIAGLQRHYPNFTVVLINQIRDNLDMGMFKKGPDYKIPYGRALKHYTSLHIHLENQVGIYNEVEKKYTAAIIKAAITKSKVGKPFGRCYVYNRFAKGLDNAKSSLMFLADNGVIKKDDGAKASYRCKSFTVDNLFIDGVQAGILKQTKKSEEYEKVKLGQANEFFKKYPWKKCTKELK